MTLRKCRLPVQYRRRPVRSPCNWFYDACTYLSDGDIESARRAALNGLRMLQRRTAAR